MPNAIRCKDCKGKGLVSTRSNRKNNLPKSSNGWYKIKCKSEYAKCNDCGKHEIIGVIVPNFDKVCQVCYINRCIQYYKENCAHINIERGPDIPLRYGSYKTEVCKDCKAWRSFGHIHRQHLSEWNTKISIEDATKEDEEV